MHIIQDNEGDLWHERCWEKARQDDNFLAEGYEELRTFIGTDIRIELPSGSIECCAGCDKALA